MSFGLCNAPGFFSEINGESCALIYLDGVLVYFRIFEEHLQHIRLVLDRFRAVNLNLKPSKYHFGQTQVNHLGPHPAKITVVQEYPVPKSVKEIRAFMVLTNYYRKFDKGFSQIASPLNDLTKKVAN